MSLLDEARRRVRGEADVDAWGLDDALHRAALSVGRIRWNVDVEGVDRLRSPDGALLVVARHRGLSEQAVVSVGVGDATGRVVRAMTATMPPGCEMALRRFGAVRSSPAELRGLLREAQLVSVVLDRAGRGERVGTIAPELVSAAIEVGVPVFPVAVGGHEFGRHWQVRVGEAVRLPAAVEDSADRAIVSAVTGAVRDLVDQGD